MNELDKQFLEAAENQDKEALEAIIKKSPNLEAKDEVDMTALAIAAKYGNLGMANFLAEAGAQVTGDVLSIANMSSQSDERMILLLQQWQMKQVKPDVSVSKKEDAELLLASDAGSVAKVKAAIKAGADLNAKDDQDTSALRWAIRKGHDNVTEVLIEAGADVNHVSDNGWTPLMEAGAMGNGPICALLLATGAEMGFKNSKGQTAEAVARYGGYDELADLLAK
ncbi:ankyrin repeat domain-containing protein [Candidatus Uhrbacteria bacterium]|nr:ankyrin repeat domain-containing protein [Candidatus Uhrbacteria bacterium]